MVIRNLILRIHGPFLWFLQIEIVIRYLIQNLTFTNMNSDTLTINVKVDPSPPAYVQNGLLTLSGSFSGTEPLNVSLPLKQVSSASAGKIQLAEGSEYQSMIKAVNVNASLLANQGVIITGTDGANILTGSNQADFISGGGGQDEIKGEAGNDRIQYETTAKIISGGSGTSDTLVVIGSNSLIVDLSETDSDENQIKTLNGSEFTDASGSLVTGFENVDASVSSGDITIIGNSSIQMVTSGGSGNDTISGGNLDDTIQGGLGNDSLIGGQGKDVLLGGAGIDIITVVVWELIRSVVVMDSVCLSKR